MQDVESISNYSDKNNSGGIISKYNGMTLYTFWPLITRFTSAQYI